MSSPALNNNIDLVTYSIHSNGSPISDTYQVYSVKVEKEINSISQCVIVIADGDAAKEEWPVSDSADFIPGALVEVQMGYESTNKTVFKGIVVSQGLRVSPGTGAMLEVVCKDEAVKMTVGRKNAAFQKKKDSEVWSTLVGNYGGLSADTTNTEIILPEIVQNYTTDWDFMLTRAEFNGMVVVNENSQVAVTDPNDQTTEVLSAKYGEDILTFDADLDALSQLSNVKSESWDYKTQQVLNGTAKASNDSQGNISTETLSKVVGLSEYLLQTTVPLESKSLDIWAKAQATKSKYAKIRGTMSIQGNAMATPGRLIDIEGMGERFSGKAYMSGVKHSLADGNWITHISMGISPEWFAAKEAVQAPLASGVIPGIQGLQNGTVKKIYDDPASEFRVLVDVPMINPDGEGIWARLSSLYATSGSGVCFYPEEGDEVILGFLNNDPRYPVILGSVHSSKNEAPMAPEEYSREKAIVTKNKLKIAFDDEKKVMTIITPSDNQVVLNDDNKNITIKDQNGNSIVMSSAGIDIQSATNMNFTAQEGIRFNANTGVTIATQGDLQLSGANVKAMADMQLSLDGGLTAELQGGTETTIKGAMVMIN